MLKLQTVQALDYAAVLEDTVEELHILGKLVPAHYQYTEAAEEVYFLILRWKMYKFCYGYEFFFQLY